MQRRTVECIWPEPEELLLELTHRDVVLDFFKDKKGLILRLRSGDALSAEGPYLSVGGRYVAKLSQSCRERLNGLAQKGYRISEARVRFVVAWKGGQDTEETAVLLPTLRLKRC